MLLFAILSSLFLFSGFAAAGVITAPGCLASWGWTFNSLGQDPCLVAAALLSLCDGGSEELPPLPLGSTYLGPVGPDCCACNTITYSLLSACDACQEDDWFSWDVYTTNCSSVLPPSTFPYPIPDGTAVPFWALTDVTYLGTWGAFTSEIIGDSPEAGPGTILAPAAPLDPAYCLIFLETIARVLSGT